MIIAIALSLAAVQLSLPKVVFPHKTQGEGLERCDQSCSPGSLGTRVRIGADLCRTEDTCREEVELESMASKMCEAWSKIFPEFLHSDGNGKQVKHDPAKGSWLPCSVFCQTTSNTWYSPRRELENYHLSSYFPDGTLCYEGDESEGNYYCQDRLCLPENMDSLGSIARTQLGKEGEFTHEDELILDQEGFIVRKLDDEELESLKNEEGFIES